MNYIKTHKGCRIYQPNTLTLTVQTERSVFISTPYVQEQGVSGGRYVGGSVSPLKNVRPKVVRASL